MQRCLDKEQIPVKKCKRGDPMLTSCNATCKMPGCKAEGGARCNKGRCQKRNPKQTCVGWPNRTACFRNDKQCANKSGKCWRGLCCCVLKKGGKYSHECVDPQLTGKKQYWGKNIKS